MSNLKQQKHAPSSASNAALSAVIDIGKLNANELFRHTLKPKPPNKTNTLKIKQFKKWVDDAHGISPINGKCITRENVDKFYLIDKRSRVKV